MTYTYGVTPAHRMHTQVKQLTADCDELKRLLAVEVARLSPDAEVLAAAEQKAQRIMMDARNARARAQRADRNAQKAATELLAAAEAEAQAIILHAEKNAGAIQETAYDKGWALSDRDYLDSKVRCLDEARAKQSTLDHYTYRRTA